MKSPPQKMSSDPGASAEPVLPVSYGKDFALLLVRNPSSLYACWEVTVEPVVLRLLRGGKPVEEHVVSRVGSWNFTVEPDREYEMEIGETVEGGGRRLLRSGRTRTPPAEARPLRRPERREERAPVADWNRGGRLSAGRVPGSSNAGRTGE